MEAERLAGWFTTFADVECAHLPLYRTLSEGLAADSAMLRLLGRAAPGQWRPVLLFTALHDVVLRHPEDEFSRYYPTVGGRFHDGTDPLPALGRFVRRHADELERLVTTKSTQTNEVNRSCLWFAAVRQAAVDLPDASIALIEIGASAGLNLEFDRYHYDFGDHVVRGADDSPVRLQCDLGPQMPPLDDPLPPVVSRVGLDIAPVDLRDDEQRRWLKACIWPEQPIRHARFDAAVEETLRNPPRLVADDAVDGVADLIDECPDDAHVVVVNSWALTYLHRDRRTALERVLDLAGTGRDLTHISAEAEGVSEWVPRRADHEEQHTVVGMRRWRDGKRTSERIAHCHAHLQWMDWFG